MTVSRAGLSKSLILASLILLGNLICDSTSLKEHFLIDNFLPLDADVPIGSSLQFILCILLLMITNSQQSSMIIQFKCHISCGGGGERLNVQQQQRPVGDTNKGTILLIQ